MNLFISYSHDNEQHKEWVTKLAGDIRSHSIRNTFIIILQESKYLTYIIKKLIKIITSFLNIKSLTDLINIKLLSSKYYFYYE